MKALTIATQIVLAPFAFALIACMQTPQYRQPVVGTESGRGYNLPWCEDYELTIGTQRAPCRPLVVHEEISECEKRFGKICHTGQGAKADE